MPDNHCCCCIRCEDYADTYSLAITSTQPQTFLAPCAQPSTNKIECGGCGQRVTGTFIVTRAVPGSCVWNGSGTFPFLLCNGTTCTNQVVQFDWSMQLSIITTGDKINWNALLFTSNPSGQDAEVDCLNSALFDACQPGNEFIKGPVGLTGFYGQLGSWNCSACSLGASGMLTAQQ